MEYLQYLINNAQLQDSLLQSYRQLSLTAQSIFLLIGTVLITNILQIDKNSKDLTFYVLESLNLLIAFISLYSAYKFYLVIKNRGEDVNYWHKKIIEYEVKKTGNTKEFTEFKVWQKYRRSGNEYLLNIQKLDKKNICPEIEKIIGKGLGHTRKVVDRNISLCIAGVWIFLIIIAVVKIFI